MERLRFNVSLTTARQIYAMLRDELGCKGPRAQEVALELARFLDRKPEEMFGMTYQELYDCVADAQLYRINRGLKP